MAWVLRLVEIGAEGEERCAEVMEISRPDSLDDIADLGLTLAEAKLVPAGVQQEIVAAQARVHALHRPACRSCEALALIAWPSSSTSAVSRSSVTHRPARGRPIARELGEYRHDVQSRYFRHQNQSLQRSEL